jgi:phosphatidylinositol glycan class N
VAIPFLIVVAVFYCIFDVIDLSIRTSFTLLMVISDLMALHFFFEIRTEGSWLDIGTSISHYIIVMLKIIIVSVLFSVAQFLFKFSLLDLGFMRSLKNRVRKFD